MKYLILIFVLSLFLGISYNPSRNLNSNFNQICSNENVTIKSSSCLVIPNNLIPSFTLFLEKDKLNTTISWESQGSYFSIYPTKGIIKDSKIRFKFLSFCSYKQNIKCSQINNHSTNKYHLFAFIPTNNISNCFGWIVNIFSSKNLLISFE